MSPVDTTPVTPFPIWARDIASDLKEAPETLSSWDNCMAKSYCKWPVIVAIIVGGVIVISILACVINCLCCGYQCCKSCCCSCCCPSPRNKNRQPKYMDDPYNPPQPYNQPYSQPPPMQPPPMQPPAPVSDPYKPSPSPASGYRGAQVARFDSPSSPSHGKFNEDALPAMPSWDNAVTRRVEDSDPHSDAMEMEPLNASNQPPHRTPSAPRPSAGGYNGAGYNNGSDYGSDYHDGGYNGAGHHGPGYMGVPPLRTGTSSSFYPESRAHDIPRSYTPQSPAVGSPAPVHPYDQQPPYHDYSPANGAGPWNARSPAPRSYTPQPQYMAMGPTMHSAEAPRPIPYRQPSPGFPQAPMGQSISPVSPMDGPRPIPYRQPSPGFNQAPVYQAMSPSIPSSPPPPFTSTAAPHEVTADPGRPPSLLQSGRKPAPNSYRDV